MIDKTPFEQLLNQLNNDTKRIHYPHVLNEQEEYRLYDIMGPFAIDGDYITFD